MSRPCSALPRLGIPGVLFVICLLPAGRLGWNAFHGSLGANPIEAVTRGLGVWALNLLLITLAITPLCRLTGQAWPMALRRMLGLFAWFYACLHLVTYVWLDQFFDWAGMLRDVAKRPFIAAGLCAFLLLLPLAITSSDTVIRRMGVRRWQVVHRAAYASAITAIVHYAWLAQRDLALPVAYGVALAALLAARMIWRSREAS